MVQTVRSIVYGPYCMSNVLENNMTNLIYLKLLGHRDTGLSFPYNGNWKSVSTSWNFRCPTDQLGDTRQLHSTLSKFWMDNFISKMAGKEKSSQSAFICFYYRSGAFLVWISVVFEIRFQIFRRKSQISPEDSNHKLEHDLESVWNYFDSVVEWIIFGIQVVTLFLTQCKY